MGNFCLMPQVAQKFKQALKDRTLDPTKLSDMSSAERRALFEQFVGPQHSLAVNSAFESKLLLKNQQQGFLTWAKQVSGIKPAARRDLIAKIERMQNVLDPAEKEQFLHDLTATRLGVDVTQEEAKNIANLSRRITETESKALPDHTFPTQEDRLAYGVSKINLEGYVNDLKLNAKKVKLFQNPILKTKDVVGATPGVLKSILASLDDSFFGRQGIKTLLDVRTSKIWLKNFAKSFVDIGRELKGKDAMHVIKADVYSRPNALNGKYKAGGYGLDALSEEAYPSAAPEKIPLFGRLFKASQSAYNGGALRMRADLADRYITIAEKHGVNTLDKKEARGIGTLIGSMTGRGNLGKGEVLSKEINVVMFSIKFLKGNFDTLTAHQLNSKATHFTKVEAAKNLASIVGSIASIMTVANTLNPGSVELDSRNSNFGKVKVFGHWVDITGGMGSLSTLASRLVPTQHDGQWGLWSKSKTGAYTNLLSGDYGAQTGLDVFNNFWEGKLSPVAGIIRDVWTGENYSGQKPTVGNVTKGVLTPIPIQTFEKLKDSSNGDKLGSMIADLLGFSVSTSPQGSGITTWSTSTNKDLDAFKQKVGNDTFNQAAKEFDKEYNNWLDAVKTNDVYKRMSDDEKTSLISKKKAEIKKYIFSQHNFKYKAPKKKKVDKSLL